MTQVWPFWLGGLSIAAVVVATLVVSGRLLGVTSGFADACAVVVDSSARRSWRLPFILGIVVGGFLATHTSSGFSWTWLMGSFDTLFSANIVTKAAVFSSGGLMLGFGARMAGGCTSGHSIVGIAQLAPSSIIATMAFMGAGLVTTQLLLKLWGVA